MNEYHQLSIGPGLTLRIDYTSFPFPNSTIFDRFLRNSTFNFGGNVGYHYSSDATDLSVGFVITPVLRLDNFNGPNFFITAGARVGYHFE